MRRKGFTPLEVYTKGGHPVQPRLLLTGFTLIELLVVMAVLSLLMAILMPALARARQQGKSVVCLSNLRQMAITAQMYADNNDDYYPLTQETSVERDNEICEYVWDFVTIIDTSDGSKTFKPGILWEGQSILEIQQCPSFKGADNWGGEPYTGYNYNASYIGGSHRRDRWSGREFFTPSARVSQVRRPAQCAIFGDGQWSGGANKFMRSPFAGKLDKGFFGRYAGTQGYRHLGKTNVAYCDGSVGSVRDCFTETYKAEKKHIAPGTGFISPDNSAYDLE